MRASRDCTASFAAHQDAPALPVSTAAAKNASGGSDPAPARLDDVLRELRLLRRAVEAQAVGQAELLNATGAAALLGLSRSTFFRLVAAGKLPKPIRLGEQLRRWRRAELLAAVRT